MTSDETLLFPEEFVGWRSWVFDTVGEILVSLDGSFEWTPLEAVEAVCKKGSHKPPGAKCSCGMYALNTLREVKKQNYHYLGDVLGQVSLWGDIEEGSQGYRARYAYPKVIYVPYLNWRIVEPLRKYQVPVRLLNKYTGKVD